MPHNQLSPKTWQWSCKRPPKVLNQHVKQEWPTISYDQQHDIGIAKDQ